MQSTCLRHVRHVFVSRKNSPATTGECDKEGKESPYVAVACLLARQSGDSPGCAGAFVTARISPIGNNAISPGLLGNSNDPDICLRFSGFFGSVAVVAGTSVLKLRFI